MDLESYLRRSQLTQSQRADLWDAFNGAKDQDSLAAALEPMNVPKEVKAGLWDMKGTPKPQKGPFAGQVLTNAPPESTGEKLGRMAMRSATGGFFSNWEEASDWFFGSKERNEMKAAGVGMAAPTPSEMVSFAASTLLPEVAGMSGLAPAVGGRIGALSLIHI